MSSHQAAYHSSSSTRRAKSEAVGARLFVRASSAVTAVSSRGRAASWLRCMHAARRTPCTGSICHFFALFRPTRRAAAGRRLKGRPSQRHSSVRSCGNEADEGIVRYVLLLDTRGREAETHVDDDVEEVLKLGFDTVRLRPVPPPARLAALVDKSRYFLPGRGRDSGGRGKGGWCARDRLGGGRGRGRRAARAGNAPCFAVARASASRKAMRGRQESREGSGQSPRVRGSHTGSVPSSSDRSSG